MKTTTSKHQQLILSALISLAIPLALPTAARAADHRDAPSLAHDCGADIADLYFFLDPNDNSKVVIIGTVHGFIVPGEASNEAIFDPALRYRFEIERSGDATADKFIDVTFNQRTADSGPSGKEILQIPKAQTAKVIIPHVGTLAGGTFTAPVLNPNLGSAANTPTSTALSADVDFFAGEVDDPFFFDIPGFSRFIASVRNNAIDPTTLDRGRDTFGGYNILAIALRLPVAALTTDTVTTIGARFLTQRRTTETPTNKGETLATGAFVTVDALGIPGVNVALVPFNKKNKYNAARTEAGAPKFANDIVATLTALGTNSSNITTLANLAVTNGDYLRLATATPNLPTDKIGGGAPTQGSGFPNGRRLRDDVIDTILNVVTNGVITAGDHVDASISQFPQQAVFPFLAPAQQPVATTTTGMPTATDDKTQN